MLSVLTPVPKAYAWYNTSWSNRIKITIPSSQVDSNLTDFPVYVDLSELPSSFFSTVQSDGDDIRITTSNGTTEVPVEIVTIDTGAETGEVHFKGTLSSTADTEFYVYYGSGSATRPARDATYGSENVWDSNFVMVLHLQEDGNSDSGGYIDSTSNNYDGTGISLTSASDEDAQMGRGQRFDGAADYIDLEDFSSEFSDAASLEMWVKLDTNQPDSDKSGIVQLGNASVTSHYVWAGGRKYVGAFRNSREDMGLAAFTRTNWHKYTVTTEDTGDSDDYKFYENATQGNTANAESSVSFNSTKKYLGASNTNAWYYFDGVMDEVRISNVARSADWISTGFNNQNDATSFFTIGAQESQVPVNMPDISTYGALILVALMYAYIRKEGMELTHN